MQGESASAGELGILRAALPLIEPYPLGVRAIERVIPGTAFFPGGDGLWKEEGPVPFPFGGVMVVGHNFDTVKGYSVSLKKGKENMHGPTWGRTLMLLQASGIDPRACFFTNFFMGLIAGDKATGTFPGQKEVDFVRRCQQYFLLQTTLMNPRMIITLGLHVPALIAPLSPDLTAWNGLRTIADLDRDPFVVSARFGAEAIPATVVGLLHPSLAGSNLRHRVGYDIYEDRVEHVILGDAVSGMLRQEDRPRPQWANPRFDLHWEGPKPKVRE